MILVLCLCLVGCSNKEVFKAENYNCYNKSEVDITSMVGCPVFYQVAADKSRIIYQIVDVRDNGAERKAKLYSYDINKKEFTALELEKADELEQNFLYGCINNEGKLFINLENEILVYDKNFKFEKAVLLEESDFYGKNLLNFQCDDKYLYLTNTSMQLLVLDYNMEVVLQEQNGVFSLCPNNSKQCLILGVSGETMSFYSIDGELKELVEIQGSAFEQEEFDSMIGCTIIQGDSNYDFYYYDNSLVAEEVTLTGVKGGEFFKIFNFTQLGIYPNEVYEVASDNQEGFVIVTSSTDSVNGTVCKMLTLEPVDKQMAEDEEGEKIEVHFAGVNISNEFEKAVFDFNASSDTYRITYKDYAAQEDDTENARKSLNLDIMKKDEIDGILFNGLRKSELSQKGILADLNGYLEASEVVSKESFETCAINAMTEEDGAIYSIYPEFTIWTIMSKEEDLTALGDYEEGLNQGKAIFAQEDSISSLYGLLVYSGDTFLKKDAFVGEEFKELLRLLKAQKDAHIVSEEDYGQMLIMEDRAVFLDEEISFTYTYMFYEKLFGDTLTCTNYGIHKPVLQPWMTEIGVMEDSEKKEGIYAFLDYMFTEENYVRYFGDVHFPVLKSIYEDRIKEMTAMEEYVDRFGNVVTPRDFEYGINDIEVVLGRMTEEQEQGLNKLLADAVYVEPMKEEYLEIVAEEAEYYFDGKKSVDEVCRNIQNRMSNAISE